MGDKHFILFRGDPRAGLDDGLPALHGHGDGLEVGQGLLLQAFRLRPVEDEVGRDAVAEEAEQRERGFAAHALGSEVDAEEGQRLLHRLHPHLGDLAGGPPHAKKRNGLGRAGREGAGPVDAFPVDLPQGGQAVLRDGPAGFRVAEGEQRGHVVDRGAVGPLGVERIDEAGEFRRPPRRRRECALQPGRGDCPRGIVLLQFIDARQEFAQVRVELLQRAEFQVVNGRHPVQELRAAQFGLDLALVGEGRARHDPHHRQLVGQHGQRGRRHADETDQHDRRHRDDENQGGHGLAALENLGGGGGSRRRLAPAPGGGGPVLQQLESSKQRHGGRTTRFPPLRDRR